MTNDRASHLLVVARCQDGRTLKGTTRDFSPLRAEFHLHPEGDGGAPAVKILVASLKAVFFVRTLEGDGSHVDGADFQHAKAQGRRIRVTFKDGEVMAGSTVGYAPNRPGFFFIPADPDSNNLRAFIVSQAVARVEFLPLREQVRAAG
ncbi:MAG TPA: hypothetical protein VFG08_01110 [Candidatus Polarisedimenticolia bacterium]|nr:hypothetical protein [Candidatus Polarisedimenticolia bacterium]